jgi:CheY-like chemotaxis protein
MGRIGAGPGRELRVHLAKYYKRGQMTPKAITKARILVIEDNPVDVYLLRRALADAEVDCELTVIEDGAEAITRVRRQGNYTGTPIPDLAIVDLNLPKHDGLEVLEAMQSSGAFTEVPVAVLTSSVSRRDREMAETLHVSQFITKPPDLQGFLEIGSLLKKLLGHHAGHN